MEDHCVEVEADTIIYSCCVEGCDSTSVSPNVSLFNFPKSDEKAFVQLFINNTSEIVTRRRAWEMKALGGQTASKTTRICSLHFEDDDFLFRDSETKKKEWLKKKAVPTKNLSEIEEVMLEEEIDTKHEVETETAPVSEYTVIESAEESPYVYDRDVWPFDKTILLIEHWIKHKKELSMPGYGKKNKIWESIADEMRVVGWKEVSGQDCDRKWRRLKNQYKALRKKKRSGARIPWRYYTILHDLLKDDTSLLKDYTSARKVVFLPTKSQFTGNDDVTIVHMSNLHPRAPSGPKIPRVDTVADDADDSVQVEMEDENIECDDDIVEETSTQTVQSEVISDSRFHPSTPTWFFSYLKHQEKLEERRRTEMNRMTTLLESMNETLNQQYELLKALFQS